MFAGHAPKFVVYSLIRGAEKQGRFNACEVILMVAKQPEDLLFVPLFAQKQVLRLLRSHQDDTVPAQTPS